MESQQQHCSRVEVQAGDLPSTSTADAEKCSICFGDLVGQLVASPENCDHHFCRTCIMEWSKENNSCPVDRIVFNHIVEFDYPHGKARHKIKIHRPWSQQQCDVEDQIICEVCGRSDDENLLMICSLCEIGYHRGCLTPPLTINPAPDWLCQDCRDHSGTFSDEKVTVSDDEIADILAEAAPTSSRLRLSTLTSAPSSMRQRCSKRLRAQANNTLLDPPQSTQHVPKYLLKATRPPTSPNV